MRRCVWPLRLRSLEHLLLRGGVFVLVCPGSRNRPEPEFGEPVTPQSCSWRSRCRSRRGRFPGSRPVIKLKKHFHNLKRYLRTTVISVQQSVPMGFSLSKSVTQVTAMHTDSKMDDHLIQGTEKTKLEPVTQLFQNTKKIRFEDTSQANFSRNEGTGTGYLSEKALGSVVYVKESDGIEMTDVE